MSDNMNPEILVPREENFVIPISEEHQTLMIQSLIDLAQTHVAASKGKLVALPADPETYPAQISYLVNGKPQPPEIIRAIGGLADSRFPKMIEHAERAEVEHGALTETANILNGNGNVIIATNHGELIDIALTQGAIYTALKERETNMRTAIILSKMISVVGYKLGDNVAPAVEVLKSLCDEEFFSFPKTPSMKGSEISEVMPDYMQANNMAMVSAVMRSLGRGGLLLAFAPSGETDKLASDKSQYVLSSMKRGTARIMQDENTHVLPVAVWLKDREPVFEIVDKPRRIESEENAHEMMQDIATVLNHTVRHRRFGYLVRKAGHIKDRLHRDN